MPEGPEVHILSIALNDMGIPTNCYGKHLFVDGEDWSFGLSGRVSINDKGILTKRKGGYMPGIIKKVGTMNGLICENTLGIDWLTSNEKEITNVVAYWGKRPKLLGALLLDQSQIAGIGVAWGSEICHRAGLRPNIKASEQDISKLAEVIVEVGIQIKIQYFRYWTSQKTESDRINFINDWFDNLYSIRTMEVYKKGKEIKVGSRRWWI